MKKIERHGYGGRGEGIGKGSGEESLETEADR